MSNENPNITISRELSQKFELYFIALVFTILGLSIQTSSITNHWYQYVFEILSWFFLLVSGLFGLSRLEWMPVAYRQYGASDIEKNNLNKLNQGLAGRMMIDENGKKFTEDELLKLKQELSDQIVKRGNEIEKVDKKTGIAYQIHKWAFVAGIISLFISRSILVITKSE